MPKFGTEKKKEGICPMKAFMEEYGVIVVAAIVIMIIVVAASPIGESIKDGITDAVGKLTAGLATAPEVSGP